jgi:hypothetical protein
MSNDAPIGMSALAMPPTSWIPEMLLTRLLSPGKMIFRIWKAQGQAVYYSHHNLAETLVAQLALEPIAEFRFQQQLVHQMPVESRRDHGPFGHA